ncbi:MAG: NAD-dependent deacylase [Veillonellaceae bacterium]|nr:NAD-dependent deacylase [Veillonellaceae bacterium]
MVTAWKASKKTVIFTGAGMSTESGLPDFRSQNGLWKARPESLATIEALRKQPNDFYFFYQWRISQLLLAQPNDGHLALAALEKTGYISQIITQNVDGLHQKAGSKKVIELHGSLRTVRCMNCKSIFDARTMVPSRENLEQDYISGTYQYGKECYCPTCNGFLRPEVVMFGEQLPTLAWEKAMAISKEADFFVVLGSSLAVSPANFCPQLALQNGAKVLVINQDKTPLDGQVTWALHSSIGSVMRQIQDGFKIK